MLEKDQYWNICNKAEEEILSASEKRFSNL